MSYVDTRKPWEIPMSYNDPDDPSKGVLVAPVAEPPIDYAKGQGADEPFGVDDEDSDEFEAE